MLAAISHRPVTGHCSCKQYYLSRTKIQYSCIQAILITTSGTVHHNCFIKEGFDTHKYVNKKAEYQDNSNQGELQGQINSTLSLTSMWIILNNVYMGVGRRERSPLHLCGINWSLQSPFIVAPSRYPVSDSLPFSENTVSIGLTMATSSLPHPWV